MLRVLKKLRKRSLDELRVRGLQAAHIYAERRSWLPQTKLIADNAFLALLDPRNFSADGRELTSPLEFGDYFRKRTGPAFFAGFSDPEVTIGELRRRWPGAEERVVAQSDRMLDGHFDLLGLNNVYFGDPIDWHLEPIAGKRAPMLHWSRLNYLDAEVAGDKKIIWELNRHQHFVTLGQAYWLTGDERYVKGFETQINSWLDQNPPKLGINWASSLEVAFRSISWLWALHFFKTSDALAPQTYLSIAKFLYLNARHLETYLSTYFSPNTHLTGEALGLFYLGTLLPEFKESARWRTTGLQILSEQLSKHVKPDGVYFEQSSYYHRYTTDFYLHLWILLRANGESVPVGLEDKLGLLLDHLMYITRPDGTTPLFGDDDGGRLVKLDRRPANDFRAALSTGASLLMRPDYKFVAGEIAEETLWLLGPEGLTALDLLQAREPAKQSTAFEAGGYYVMRDGWKPTSNYLFFDCGPHGAVNCGHAHADALSFEVAANGRTQLIDPGTCTYTGSKELRDWFRSSLAHNAFTVDGESSSVPDGPFSWKSIARAEAAAWISRERFDYIEGKHDGYLRLPAPVAHTRSILFLKNDYWIVRDCVASNSEHQYALWFHLNSDVSGRVDAEKALVLSDFMDEASLKIFAFAGDGNWAWEEAWVSQCYGERVPAPVSVFSANAADEEFVTFLLPLAGSLAGGRAEPAPVRVSEIETIGGQAFEVISEKTVDLAMIREGERIETARMASDFDWTWARFSGDASIPEELILIGGQTLELEGQEILKSRRRLSHLVARRRGDGEFRISDCEFRSGDGDPRAEIEFRNPKSEIRNF